MTEPPFAGAQAGQGRQAVIPDRVQVRPLRVGP